MISGFFEGLCAITIASVGGIYIIGQIKENSRRNQEDIEAIKTMIHEYQEDMKEMLKNNIDDMKVLIDKEKNSSRESLKNEITHLRELVNINASETRADIQRLQMEQKESNNLKMKVAVLTSSVKALHKRLDLEPSPLLNSGED